MIGLLQGLEHLPGRKYTILGRVHSLDLITLFAFQDLKKKIQFPTRANLLLGDFTRQSLDIYIQLFFSKLIIPFSDSRVHRTYIADRFPLWKFCILWTVGMWNPELKKVLQRHRAVTSLDLEVLLKEAYNCNNILIARSSLWLMEPVVSANCVAFN